MHTEKVMINVANSLLSGQSTLLYLFCPKCPECKGIWLCALTQSCAWCAILGRECWKQACVIAFGEAEAVQQHFELYK